MIKAKHCGDGVKSCQNLAFWFCFPSIRFCSWWMTLSCKDPDEESVERVGCSLSNNCAVFAHDGVVLVRLTQETHYVVLLLLYPSPGELAGTGGFPWEMPSILLK